MKRILSIILAVTVMVSCCITASAELVPVETEESNIFETKNVEGADGEYTIGFSSEWSEGHVQCNISLVKYDENGKEMDSMLIDGIHGFRDDSSLGIWTRYSVYNLPQSKILVEYICGVGAAGPNGPWNTTRLLVYDVSGDKIIEEYMA
ncbi:MAG: hypothetical protein Q4C42_07290 [Clostridia bacterium]|nr:hypothetical protein [Clostridia bacterium]